MNALSPIPQVTKKTAPKKASVPAGPRSSYSIQDMANLWKQAGGDPSVADLMGHVAYAESTGDPTALNHYTDHGKTYTVHGLWQVSSIHGDPAKFTSPLDNARKAVELYNAQHLSPWEDSRNKGAGGGWGAYYTNAQNGTRGGRRIPMARKVPADPLGLGAFVRGGTRAMPNPHAPGTSLTLSPFQGAQATGTTTQSAGARYSSALGPAGTPFDDPSNAQGPQAPPPMDAEGHTILDQLGGVVNVLPVAIHGVENSMVRGQGPVGPQFQRAMGTYLHNPASAADEFGYEATPEVNFLEVNSPQGSLLKNLATNDEAHPEFRGPLAFLANMLDPVQGLIGHGLGRAGGALHEAVSASPAGRSLLNVASPYRGIAVAGGDSAANAMKAMASRVRAHEGTAQDLVTQIFGGLNHDQQLEVLRLSEPLPKGRIHTADGGADLQRRAQLYRNLIRSTTKAKQAVPGLLDQSRVFNPDMYHPMSGAFTNPEYDEHLNNILEELGQIQHGQTPVGTDVRRGTGAVNGPHKGLSARGIQPSLDSGLMRPDYSPAGATRRFVSNALQNIEFENSIRGLPSSIRRDISPSDYINGLGQRLPGVNVRSATQRPQEALDQFIQENQAHYPKGNPERYELKPLDGLIPANAALRSTSSQALKESLVHPELARFLNNKAGSTISGVPTKAFLKVTLPTEINGVKVPGGGTTLDIGEALDKYNSTMRQAIITNPVFHPLWNLRENMAAQGDMPIAAVRQTLKTLVGAFTKKGHDWWDKADAAVFHEANMQSKAYKDAVAEAINAGATAEMHATRSAFGRDISALNTMPWKEARKSVGSFADKVLTNARDWNTRATFGPTGEQAFSTRLFQRLKRLYPKAKPEDLGNMVREALGNYQNVDPNSPMSRLFFFYPWLKGNTAFWMKKFLTNPKYAIAPLEGIRTANAAMGDPNGPGQGAQRPTPDYQLFKGFDANGNPEYITLPLPQRAAGEIANAATSGNPSEIGYTLDKILRGHATPGVGMAMDTLGTLASQADSPAVGYSTVFDKAAPAAEQWKQILGYGVSHGLPIPLLQYQIQDAVRTGQTPGSFAAQLMQTAGLGYASTRQDPATYKRADAARRQFSSAAKRAREAGDQQAYQEAYDAYQDALRQLGLVK